VVERLVVWIGHGFGYLFAIAFVSVLGALVLGLFPHEVRQWGWLAGALLAVVGYPVGWVSFPDFKARKMTRAEQEADERRPRKHLGPVAGSLVGILIGVILGLLVGFVLIVFWLSLALSPFTPDTWREGMHVGFLSVSMTSWTGLALLGWPIAAFSVFGIVLGLCGQVYRY
jgi:hypothetical protein